MILSLIAAMSQNRVIGVKQDLPWHLPEDLERFKSIIRGHPLIMGRKTFDTIPQISKLSRHIVITRNPQWKPKTEDQPFVETVHSLKAALDLFSNYSGEVFVLGGGEIYAQSVDLANRIYLTVIHKDFDGDTFFPPFDESKYKVTFRKEVTQPLPFSFIDFERKN